MEEENPLYFGMDSYESVEAKKNLLSAEMFLLNMIKIIRRYNLLRAEELGIKFQIYKSVKKLDAAVKKTNSSFPFLKIPQKTGEELVRKEAKTIKEKFDEDLESQLREIQERLKSIS